jgi:hypothetical protein
VLEGIVLTLSCSPEAEAARAGYGLAERDGSVLQLVERWRRCIHPPSLSITHISDGAFALSESFVILFVTPIRGGVTDERGEGIQYIRLA